MVFLTKSPTPKGFDISDNNIQKIFTTVTVIIFGEAYRNM